MIIQCQGYSPKFLLITYSFCLPVSSNSSTAHKPCPDNDWKLHGGKCYWVATHKKSWVESTNDCTMKNSQLMVIRDFIDMVRYRAQRLWHSSKSQCTLCTTNVKVPIIFFYSSLLFTTKYQLNEWLTSTIILGLLLERIERIHLVLYN